MLCVSFNFSIHTSVSQTFSVLRSLCRNPHGLFWAGDTAQTIAAGSSFRFDDLKAFLFRIEVNIILSTDVLSLMLPIHLGTKFCSGNERPSFTEVVPARD